MGNLGINSNVSFPVSAPQMDVAPQAVKQAALPIMESQAAAQIVNASNDQAPPLSNRAAAQLPPISFDKLNRFDAKEITNIRNAKSEEAARGTVSTLRRALEKALEFLLSRFSVSYTTKSDAAAALYAAVNNKPPLEAYKALRELVRPEERYNIKPELTKDDIGNQHFTLSIGGIKIIENTAVTAADITATRKLEQEDILKRLQHQNPFVKVDAIQDEISKNIENALANVSKQDRFGNMIRCQDENTHQLALDLPRAKYVINNQRLEGILSYSGGEQIIDHNTGEKIPKTTLNLKLFSDQIEKELSCTEQQKTAITALAHQRIFANIYNNIEEPSTIVYIRGGSNDNELSYTLEQKGDNILFSAKLKTSWQDLSELSDNSGFAPKPETMKEPVVSIQFEITPDGNAALTHVNFCSIRD